MVPNYSIICVDDDEDILNAYKSIFTGNNNASSKTNQALLQRRQREKTGGSNEVEKQQLPFNLFVASSGEEALDIVRKELSQGSRIAIGFFDMTLPGGIDGQETIRRMRILDNQILCTIVTAYTASSRKGLSKLFKREDDWLFFNKPFSTAELLQAASHLLSTWNNRREVEMYEEDLKNKNISVQNKANSAAIISLAGLAELRDNDTGTHLKRVARYCRLVATELAKRSEPLWCEYITEKYINDLAESSVLHDIGKVGIPDSILLKPGKLTAEEFETMKSHSSIGGDVLSNAVSDIGEESFLTLGREIAYNHHEKYDGTGYPKGLSGEDIPLSARILAVADVYDALTSDRPYRKAMTHTQAADVIINEMGEAHFDPVILEIFTNIEEKFNLILQSDK